MKAHICTIVLLTLLNCVNVLNARANVTLADLITCKEYSIKSGYIYRDFFEINKLDHAKVSNGSEVLRLKFYVQAAKDAHILLANTLAPKARDKVYEIVIGAGGNTFSVIRYKLTSGSVTTKSRKNILSMWDPTPIEIVQTRGNGTEGKLTVNLIGFDEPHLEASDSNLMEINHVSFSSYGDTRAKWYYDCKLNSSASDDEIEIEERKLPEDIRLIRDLSPSREMPPAELSNITLNFALKGVAYEHKKGIMSTRCGLFMTWIDSRLRWNPLDYGNLTSFKSYLFWTPKLRVSNGLGASFKVIPAYFQSTIYHNGTVTARNTDTQIDSWCPDTAQSWPHDSIECRIEISVTNSEARLYYDRSMVVPMIQQALHWNVHRIAVQLGEGTYAVTIALEQNDVFYKQVYYSPAFVAELLVLLSFFLEGQRRGGMIMLAFSVLCITFMYIASNAPTNYVPKIVRTYEIVLGTATFSYFLHILIIWFTTFPPKAQPHSWVMATINWSALRRVLGIDYSDSKEYLEIQRQPWKEVARIANKLVFLFVFVFFAVLYMQKD